MGTDAQWAKFDKAWRAKLAAPLPGKPALQRFHMTQCFNRRGKLFNSYTQAESEQLIGDLTQIIIYSGVSGYAMAVEREAWEKFIQGDVEALLGDAERNCVTNCILMALKWARATSQDKRLSIVFDNRPHRTEANERIFSLFQRHFLSGDAGPPEPSIAFESSVDLPGLQGADIPAWEIYRYCDEILAKGHIAPKRSNLQKIVDTGRFYSQFANEAVVRQLALSVGEKEMLGPAVALLSEPARVFPPSLRIRSPDGEARRLEPAVTLKGQSPFDLPRKRWTPIGRFQGSRLWPHPPLLRRMTPEPSPSGENSSEEDQA